MVSSFVMISSGEEWVQCVGSKGGLVDQLPLPCVHSVALVTKNLQCPALVVDCIHTCHVEHLPNSNT
jgi:hypothetical protein